MKVVFLKSTEGLYEVELSDGSLLSLRSCYLPQEILNGLPEPGQGELDPVAEESLRFAADCLRAEKAALRLIARAEQCSAGLSRKLERRMFNSDCTDAVISRLTGLKLIDDQRFARLWLESRLGLCRSPHRLLAGLVNRGIDMNCAKSVLNEVLDEETEFSLLRRFAKKHSRLYDKRELEYLLKREGFSKKTIKFYFENF